ncbi:MAG: TIGR03915 family putative DNA repair protein [Bacillota bacterium]|jgi:probable DNA metabolism protein
MFTYFYDGSLEGLLTALATTVDSDAEIQAITTRQNFQPDLFSEVREIITDQNMAMTFLEQLRARFRGRTLTTLGKCFLAETPGSAMTIRDFIRLLFKYGERIAWNSANATVRQINRIGDQVSYEVLRLQGFVRFRQLATEEFYAAIEPDHNVIRLLAPLFAARFADQQWLIHDLKRQTGIYYDGAVCRFLPEVTVAADLAAASRPFTANLSPTGFAAAELEYQTIWNQYFQAIAIPERANPRAQRQRMPRRYWKHLVERVET